MHGLIRSGNIKVTLLGISFVRGLKRVRKPFNVLKHSHGKMENPRYPEWLKNRISNSTFFGMKTCYPKPAIRVGENRSGESNGWSGDGKKGVRRMGGQNGSQTKTDSIHPHTKYRHLVVLCQPKHLPR